jgi:transposase-like protein
MAGMATRRSAEEIQRMLEEYRQSGEARKAYCQRHGIPVTTLDYYLHRQALKARPRLARVKLAARSADPTATFALVLRNGRRIESGWGFGDADLARLIRVAEAQ